MEEPVPEACLVEVRAKGRKTVTTALAMKSKPAMLCNVIQSEASVILDATCESQPWFWSSLSY